MKKKYSTPIVENIHVKVSSYLAASPTLQMRQYTQQEDDGQDNWYNPNEAD